MIDIASESDDMKADAEIIHEKYKSKLASLDEAEQQIKAKLEARLTEIKDQIKAAKTILFDAKIQYKSNEITETPFETVKLCIFDIIERLSHESTEISNVQKRIVDLDEVQHTTDPKQKHQESPVSYLDSSNQELVHTNLPEAPTHPPGTTPRSIESEVSANFPEPPQKETQTSDNRSDESDWLA